MSSYDVVGLISIIITFAIEYYSMMYLVKRPNPNRNTILTAICFVIFIVIIGIIIFIFNNLLASYIIKSIIGGEYHYDL